MPIIELTPTQTIMYNEVMFDGSITTDGFIYVGSYTSGTTGWTDTCVIGVARDIAAVGHIIGVSLTISGQSVFIFSRSKWRIYCVHKCREWHDRPFLCIVIVLLFLNCVLLQLP